MQEDEEKLREGQLKYRRAAEQTTLFLSLFILTLGIMFLTRDREELLKEEIVTLLPPGKVDIRGICDAGRGGSRACTRDAAVCLIAGRLVFGSGGLLLGTDLSE